MIFCVRGEEDLGALPQAPQENPFLRKGVFLTFPKDFYRGACVTLVPHALVRINRQPPLKGGDYSAQDATKDRPSRLVAKDEARDGLSCALDMRWCKSQNPTRARRPSRSDRAGWDFRWLLVCADQSPRLKRGCRLMRRRKRSAGVTHAPNESFGGVQNPFSRKGVLAGA